MYQSIKIIDKFVPIQKFIEEKAIDQIIPLKRDPDQIARSDMMWIKEELLCLNDIVTALHHQGNHQQV